MRARASSRAPRMASPMKGVLPSTSSSSSDAAWMCVPARSISARIASSWSRSTVASWTRLSFCIRSGYSSVPISAIDVASSSAPTRWRTSFTAPPATGTHCQMSPPRPLMRSEASVTCSRAEATWALAVGRSSASMASWAAARSSRAESASFLTWSIGRARTARPISTNRKRPKRQQRPGPAASPGPGSALVPCHRGPLVRLHPSQEG